MEQDHQLPTPTTHQTLDEILEGVHTPNMTPSTAAPGELEYISMIKNLTGFI